MSSHQTFHAIRVVLIPNVHTSTLIRLVSLVRRLSRVRQPLRVIRIHLFLVTFPHTYQRLLTIVVRQLILQGFNHVTSSVKLVVVEWITIPTITQLLIRVQPYFVAVHRNIIVYCCSRPPYPMRLIVMIYASRLWVFLRSVCLYISVNFNDKCSTIIAPFVPLFDGLYRNSTAFADCEQFPYYLRIDEYLPAYLVYIACDVNEVWLNSMFDCVSIANSGCRKCVYWLLWYCHSARTRLPCQSDCGSIDALRSSTSINRPNGLQTFESVIWNGCKSIYVLCPNTSRLATYNSFIDYAQIYDLNNATVYCGKYKNYYILYKNTKLNGKMCTNSFDRIDCIRM